MDEVDEEFRRRQREEQAAMRALAAKAAGHGPFSVGGLKKSGKK